MTPKAGDELPSSGKGKAKREQLEDTLGPAEALDLIDQMEAQLAKLEKFLAEERHAAKRKNVSTKRLARLRLVSDDIASAAKLSAKSFKA